LIYLLLFFEFFKIGIFSFGGGYATMPFLYHISDTFLMKNYQECLQFQALRQALWG